MFPSLSKALYTGVPNENNPSNKTFILRWKTVALHWKIEEEKPFLIHTYKGAGGVYCKILEKANKTKSKGRNTAEWSTHSVSELVNEAQILNCIYFRTETTFL